MPFLPLELTRIAAKQLSPSLPLSRNQNIQKENSQRQLQKTTDGKHWFIAGKTGMGKTTLMKKIVTRMMGLHKELNLYIVDTKKIGDFTSRDGTVIMSEVAPDAFTTGGNRQVWQPLDDDEKQYNIFFKRILDAKIPAIVLIDETVNMKFAGGRIPRELSILLLQGRAAGIHVLGGTQEVAKSPRQLLSQATYIVSFSLNNAYDERTMINYLSLSQNALGLRKYQFYYRDTDSDKPAIKYADTVKFLELVH